jgi:ABC-type transport system substrate-binding protein
MALTLDRQAFIDILTEGKGPRAAVMPPPPGGLWGMPPEMLAKLPGYGPDVAANRTEARAIMRRLGYGPDKRLAIAVSTRDIPAYCNPEMDALIDQQWMEPDQEKRRHLVWEIERRLVEDGAKPLVYFNRGDYCWDPNVTGVTIMVNSIYNGWRMEDVWLNR